LHKGDRPPMDTVRWGFRAGHLADGLPGRTLFGAFVLLGGCMSSGPAQDKLRIAAQPAPADLQLACVGAVAAALGVNSISVMPVSSYRIDAQSYQVDLEVLGARAICIADAAGKVLSVRRA
jgi:hypothetical protein